MSSKGNRVGVSPLTPQVGGVVISSLPHPSLPRTLTVTSLPCELPLYPSVRGRGGSEGEGKHVPGVGTVVVWGAVVRDLGVVHTVVDRSPPVPSLK